MPQLPKDPVILLSFTNTQLRDNYSSLTELSKAYMVEECYFIDKLKAINYEYDGGINQFI